MGDALQRDWLLNGSLTLETRKVDTEEKKKKKRGLIYRLKIQSNNSKQQLATDAFYKSKKGTVNCTPEAIVAFKKENMNLPTYLPTYPAVFQCLWLNN